MKNFINKVRNIHQTKNRWIFTPESAFKHKPESKQNPENKVKPTLNVKQIKQPKNTIMKQKTFIQKTPVVFRKYRDGQIIALFPYLIDNGYFVTSYMRIGQHSAADYDKVILDTRLAKMSDYRPLLEELESIGYCLQPIQKRNHAKYLKSYYKSNKN